MNKITRAISCSVSFPKWLLQAGVNTEKVHIECEKCAQISILANKIATQ